MLLFNPYFNILFTQCLESVKCFIETKNILHKYCISTIQESHLFSKCLNMVSLPLLESNKHRLSSGDGYSFFFILINHLFKFSAWFLAGDQCQTRTCQVYKILWKKSHSYQVYKFYKNLWDIWKNKKKSLYCLQSAWFIAFKTPCSKDLPVLSNLLKGRHILRYLDNISEFIKCFIFKCI